MKRYYDLHLKFLHFAGGPAGAPGYAPLILQMAIYTRHWPSPPFAELPLCYYKTHSRVCYRSRCPKFHYVHVLGIKYYTWNVDCKD